MNLPKRAFKILYTDFHMEIKCGIGQSLIFSDEFPMDNFHFLRVFPAIFDFVTAQVAKQLPGLKLPNTLMFDYPSPQVRCNLDQDGVQLKKGMAIPLLDDIAMSRLPIFERYI